MFKTYLINLIPRHQIRYLFCDHIVVLCRWGVPAQESNPSLTCSLIAHVYLPKVDNHGQPFLWVADNHVEIQLPPPKTFQICSTAFTGFAPLYRTELCNRNRTDHTSQLDCLVDLSFLHFAPICLIIQLQIVCGTIFRILQCQMGQSMLKFDED